MSRELPGTALAYGVSIFDVSTPGAFTFSEGDAHLMYCCPCCGEQRGIPISTGQKEKSHWLWDGNREKPTLSPSIWHRGDLQTPPQCSWHGWLRRGVWVWA